MKVFICRAILLILFMMMSVLILMLIKMVWKYGFTEILISVVNATIVGPVTVYWYESLPLAIVLEIGFEFIIQGIFTTRGEQPLDQI